MFSHIILLVFGRHDQFNFSRCHSFIVTLAFHSQCIIPWLTERSPTCPLCKALMEVEREGDEQHRRQREEQRRAAEQEGEERLQSDDDDAENDESDPIFASLRSWYNSNIRRYPTHQVHPDQEQESQSPSNNQEVDVEMARTQESEAEQAEVNRDTSSLQARLPASLRRIIQGSRSADVEIESRTQMEDIQQPLLDSGRSES